MLRRNRTNPKVILYHRIDGCETEMLATLDCRTHIFLLQLFPQLRTCFLQIGLRHIENPEHLHIRIDIVLLFFIIGEFLVILILDFLFRLFVDTRKRGQHDRKGLLAAQHGDTRQFLFVLAGIIEPLHTVERAETWNLISLILTVQQQHKSVHAVILAP